MFAFGLAEMSVNNVSQIILPWCLIEPFYSNTALGSTILVDKVKLIMTFSCSIFRFRNGLLTCLNECPGLSLPVWTAGNCAAGSCTLSGWSPSFCLAEVTKIHLA